MKIREEAGSALMRLARKLDEEACADYPVGWVADEIRRIVYGLDA